MNNCKVKYGDYHSDALYTWCSNCGNYGVHAAIKRALVDRCIAPRDAAFFFDIGCNGNGSDKIDGYRLHGLHGRVIPAAVGAHLANRRLEVIAFGGDGATLNEGMSHFIHGIRSDYNIMFVIHNNGNFALTKGQASSATRKGKPMNSSFDGPVEETLNILNLALSLNPTFVARTFSGNVKHMTNIFKAGMNHNGFSVVEVMQNCPTYNKETNHQWYQERIYDVTKTDSYNITDLELAKKTSLDLDNKIAMGILYQKERGGYLSHVLNRKDKTTELVDEVEAFDVKNLLKKFQ